MMRELVEREAIAAAAALPSLNDAAVGSALRRAAQLLEERAREVLAANERDVDAARGKLDEGALDRLRLDESRVATLARQLETTAALEPLEREIASRTLANGLRGARAAHSGRHDRGELRGEAGSGARHRRPGPEEPERGRAPHGWRGARDGRDAGRRGAAAGARGRRCRPAARSGSCARPIAAEPRRSFRCRNGFRS